ncbi:PhzF family phenazine biosynthesis protein [Rheinheimera riviphila]|uniref:PhzF family phenazine biosynthesis protein n=1 Tax=Rheinheimera riviphila TaxID=1834037 RepID=A0A437QES5_9GAMM|nr:PhzF family phenazine biosynthesis protein [Rheinheimera riviphila]RVU33078.1 PhzF family phenazine biosynthesis protein [Rheinheimera riviphila]
MRLALYQVDAFTNQRFRGNAAAVVPLASWLDDALMLQIAQENNLSETAFLLELAPGHYHIRWFSPLTEIDFCGHATLASAYVIFMLQPELPEIRFSTGAVGDLTVSRTGDWLQMSFPKRLALPVSEVPPALLQGLGAAPLQVLRSDQAWFAIYADAATVVALTPDMQQLKQLGPWDVVVTAPGAGFVPAGQDVEHQASQYDFIGRYFWPANGGDEDPVTGSIHAGLAPYWAGHLGKNQLLAYQASTRGGVLRLEISGERVLVSGQVVLYLKGEIEVG